MMINNNVYLNSTWFNDNESIFNIDELTKKLKNIDKKKKMRFCRQMLI